MTLTPSPSTDRSATSGAGAWAIGWTAAVLVATALVLIVWGGAPPRALWALGLAAALGVTERLRPRRPGRSREPWRAWLWAGGVAVAAGLTGGVGGPFSPLFLMPLAAEIAGGGRWRDGTAPGFAAVAAIGVAGAGGALPPGFDPATALPLGLAALLPVLALAAAAVMLRSAPPAAPAAAISPPVEADARVAAAEAARDAAEADARGKMQFLANMSHELRTPLNAIMGFSDIMRSCLFGELQPRYAEYAELIHESGGHLLELINDVLDVSKIEADRYVLAREVFDVREAAQGALRLLRQQADDAGVRLQGVLPPEPLEVDADRRAVKQIVLNLLTNALKFTSQGGSVILRVSVVAGALEIAVADTGKGIAAEDLQRLGRPFEQAGDASDRRRGTGLGLSLVKAFARLHDGELTLESRLGEGTAATVRLPVLAEPLADAQS